MELGRKSIYRDEYMTLARHVSGEKYLLDRTVAMFASINMINVQEPLVTINISNSSTVSGSYLYICEVISPTRWYFCLALHKHNKGIFQTGDVRMLRWPSGIS